MKKNKLIKETLEKNKSLQLSVEAMKHDAAMRNEVEERATNRLEELFKENETLTKGIKTQRDRNKCVLVNDKLKKKENNKLTLEKKGILKELENIREINGKLNKENSDLTIKMKTKEKLVESLQEALGIEDAEDEVEDVVSPNNEEPSHECNACNRQFKTNPDLERHIQAKHVEYPCTYCDKVFSREAALVQHHAVCDGLRPANSRCNKCNKIFTTQGLTRHLPTCHDNKKLECSPCGEIFKSLDEVKKHKKEEHDMELVKSRVVCKHWRKGHCSKGASCLYSHVGHQNQPATTSKSTTRVPACSNGAECEWLARGSCSYFHPRVGVQKPWSRTERNNGRRQDTRPSQDSTRPRNDTRPRQERSPGQDARSSQVGTRPRQVTRNHQGSNGDSRREICRYDGRCDRIPNCPQLHILSLEDFPLFQGRRIPVVGRNPHRRRN